MRKNISNSFQKNKNKANEFKNKEGVNKLSLKSKNKKCTKKKPVARKLTTTFQIWKRKSSKIRKRDFSNFSGSMRENIQSRS